MQIADLLVLCEELREALKENGIALKFVKFLHNDRLGKRQASFSIRFSGDLGGMQMAEGWPGADTDKEYLASRPIFAQEAGLGLAEGGKLVVIFGKKRSLGMAE